MATDAETGTRIDAAAVWRAIGRLEAAIAALKDCQVGTNRRLDAGFVETNRCLETGFLEINGRIEGINGRIEEINRRIDRTTYTVLAGGSVLLVAIFAVRFVGS